MVQLPREPHGGDGGPDDAHRIPGLQIHRPGRACQVRCTYPRLTLSACSPDPYALLRRLGLDHLVGTPALKPYMHGYFVSLELYDAARVIANPYAYAEHRERIASNGEVNPFDVEEQAEAYKMAAKSPPSKPEPPADEDEFEEVPVGSECIPIRTLGAWVNGVAEVECILDPGCSIVAISEEKAYDAGLSYECDTGRAMQSANSTIDTTLGVANNVPFEIAGGIIFYMRVHVVRNAPYDVLLGRPFDALLATEIVNGRNGHQTLRVTDPTSKRRFTIPTYDRGCAPKVADHPVQQKGFRPSRN